MPNHSRDLDELGFEGDYPLQGSERRVLSQSYDISVNTLLDQWSTGTIIVPETERNYVWDDIRAGRLVESLLLNVPIPLIYLAENRNGQYEIIDGYQRLYSIIRYVKGEFPLESLMILHELNGYFFSALPDRDKRTLLSRMLRTVIISNESSPDIKFEIFQRLNSGAVSLNAQEMRNFLYHGSFNQLLHDLATNKTYRYLIGSGVSRQRMMPEELALRFFALRERLSSYHPPMGRFLNEYMRELQNASEGEVSILRNVFLQTLDLIKMTLDLGAFRLTDEYGTPQDKTINRALYDAQMVSFSFVVDRHALDKRQQVLRRMAKLYQSPEFLDSIRQSTGDRLKIHYRIRMVMEVLQSAQLDMSIPTYLLA